MLKFLMFLAISFAFYYTYREGIYAPFANMFTKFLDYKYSLPEPSYLLAFVFGAIATLIISD